MFHPRCGRCVHLANGNKTAFRSNPTQEFNRGLIFSLEPIKDNEVFEVTIDKKLNTWSGSIELGVTVCNPDVIDIPITATDLRGGTWIMLGQGVLRDGRSLHEAYGCDLDKLVEGDRVGVMRTSQGDLKFFVNGDCQGVAAANLPQMLYAVVDMYGKCAQVTVTAPATPDSNTLDEDSISEVSSLRDSNILDSQLDPLPPLALASSTTTITTTTTTTTTPTSTTNTTITATTTTTNCSNNTDNTDNSSSSPAILEAPGAAATTTTMTTATTSLPSLTSSSALSNHVANISIANSLMSNSDSNLLHHERDGQDSGGGNNNDVPFGASLRPPDALPHSPLPEAMSVCNNINNNNSTETTGTPSGYTMGGAVGGCGSNNKNNNDNNNAGGGGDKIGANLGPGPVGNNSHNTSDNMVGYSSMSDRLRFHDKCGTLVKLSNGARTAERRRPLDEFNNGVVMSYRALKENELFEIRIDRLVDKWSGSIEVGITTHNPGLLDFPATMTNMRSGTTMMSGTGILTNGKGTHREYGEFNLDELKEGDRIGMMIKTGGELHYYINGLDQGIAATTVPSPVWSVVDLYGMTVKVTIVERDEREEQNLITRRNTQLGETHPTLSDTVPSDEDTGEAVLFHPSCGTYAQVINNGRTAHRPNAADDFNNGVVLTRRPLKPNEMFEVRLDRCVDKWAGSLEIGVTTHPPTDLEYPSTMTNVRSGTWMMTGNGVMHNGTTIIDDYGQNLDRLKVGDRVGVLRKDNGNLYFFVNGVDQGLAASNVPEHVFGVVDLYGQAAQATVVQHTDHCSSDVLPSSVSSSTIYSDLRFHHLHGKNARILTGGLTAQRPNAHGEFNDAIVISNRQLHEGEMFEVMIDKMVDRWSGSLEAGVTAIPPEDIDFPSTMTDIDYDTWMLSGSSVMRDGVTVMNNYRCDLDSLVVGTRVGMMRHPDGSLHYYVNGEDQGTACENLPPGLWPVIDLYGQCAQVTIVHNPIRHDQSLISVSQYLDMSHLSLPAAGQASVGSEVIHRFSKCCGANITLSTNNTTATRVRHYNHGLVFTSHPLEPEEVFEVSIDRAAIGYCGSLSIGLTSLPISDSYPTVSLPATVSGIEAADAWWVSGSDVWRNGSSVLRLNYCPNLGRLLVGDRVGIKRTSDGAMRLFINGEDFGVAATNITKRVFGVVDLFGFVESVVATSVSRQASSPVMDSTVVASNNNAVSQDSLELSQPESRQPPGLGSLSSGFHPATSAHIPPPDVRVPVDSKALAAEHNRQEAGQSSRHSQPLDARSVTLRDQDLQTEHRQGMTSNNKDLSLIQFHENTGKNILLSPERLSARRSESYNQGVVMSARPIPRNTLFQVRLGQLNPRWSSSLMLGVTAQSPEKLHLPNTAFALKRNTWIMSGDSVFYNGVKIKGRYGPDLDSLAGGHVVGVRVDHEARLHLLVNGVDQGVAAKEIPPIVYVVLDLYGQCQEVAISSTSSVMSGDSGPINATTTTNTSSTTTTATASSTATNILPITSTNTIVTTTNSQAGQEQNKKNLLKTHHHQQHHHHHHNHHTHNIQQQQQHQQQQQLPQQQQQQQQQALQSQQPTSQLPSGHHPDNSNSNITNEARQPSLNIEVEHITQPHPPKDKDKGVMRSLPDSTMVKNCEYQNMCYRFKASLALPEGYFSLDGNLCYCETCHKIRGDEQYYTKGNPPKHYTQPFGWCRFSLVSGVGDNNESWHMAYHGTRPGAVRRMLDKGELLFPGELGVSSTLAGRRSKDDDSDGSQLSFSPTIIYASAQPFAPAVLFVDPCTRKRVQVRVVLQVAVKPGSYKVGSSSVPWTPTPDTHLHPDSIEWVTKERGATQLLALLVSVEEK